ncbi:putative 60S ribosomal protein L7a-1 [Paratrimastix pyriformis]|uniref:60S ribosomal protein L7a n=2 Tax=Paratrimastix TaxID=1709327 RepID=Q3SAE0_9EUKA|nr:ribosomal protein L7A [Paratrimastix pyriformis]KAJ4456791.1 putative 60S ribosomal protein L7a-1 [Paratrimastix pyriformis]
MPKEAARKPVAKKTAGKKPVQQKKESEFANLIAKRPRSFHVGGDVHPPRDVSRYVKWPKYIRLQRQKKVMYQRMKTPAMINQFTQTLDKHVATEMFKLLHKYRPEDKKAKKERLLKLAEAKKEGKQEEAPKKPMTLKCGLNHITTLVEQKKAKLVVIAHDVDPIELVIWLPTLCRKMDVPYCIVKGKARLGTLVGLKTATCLALTDVKPEDKKTFSDLVAVCRTNYIDRAEAIVRQQGGGKLGVKSAKKIEKRQKALAKDEKQREKM